MRVRWMVLLLVTFALPFTVASGAPPPKEWAILGWFSADDAHDVTIEEAHFQNMEDLARTGSGARLEIVVQADRGQKASGWLRDRYSDPDYRGAKRFHIEKGNVVPVASLGEVNMGSPKALLEFLTWAARTYPAKRYLVVFNSHGSGTLSWSGPGSTSRTPGARPDLGLGRYVAYDDTDDDCLTIREIAATLKQFADSERGGRKVEMIAFDACMSATVEALHEVRDGAQLLAASEALMPGEGLNYRAIGAAILDEPSIAPEVLGEVMARSFITRAEPGNVFGVYRSDGSEDLAAACSKMARELYTAGKELGAVNLHRLAGMFNEAFDLESVARAVVEPTGPLKTAANAAALAAAGRKVIASLAACRTSLKRSGTYAKQRIGGLSILWPDGAKYQEYRAFYKATSFAKATLWDEFLDWRELGMTPREP